MKNTLVIIVLTTLMGISCGDSPSGNLAEKKSQRDSLKMEIKLLTEKLGEVERWIEQNDTTVLKNLTLVTVIPFQLSPYEHYVEVHGTVNTDNDALLYSMMGGEVQDLKVDQGDPVRKGQLLAAIDAGALRKNIAQLESQLELATDVYVRQQKLWKEQNIGSEIQFLEAKTNKESLEASLESLRSQLRSSQIYAPFDGVVDEIFLREGEMAGPASPVIRVVSLGKARIEADVAEEYLAKLSEGDSVQVFVNEMDTMISARIDQIGSYINPANRTFRISLKVANGMKLRPNQLTTVRIRDVVKDRAYVLPSRLLMEDASGDSYVYVTESGKNVSKIRKVYVERLISGKDEVLISPTDELRAGDRLVDQGARLVVETQRVRVSDGA
jgi:RND family efflux transporter MFP subunit